MKEESFKRRYVVKIASSVLIALLNMIIQMILPRALSVEEFGYYSYNLNVFTSVVGLANLSTSNALVTKYSKRNDEIGIVYFYLKFYGLETILLSIGMMVLFPISIIQESFAGQTFLMIMLGLETAASTKFLQDIIGIYDSMAIAVTTALAQILLKIAMCAFVAISFFLGRLDLALFYAGQIQITLIVSFLLLRLAIGYQKKRYPVRKIEKTTYYVKEFAEFCSPLIAATAVSQLITIAMNWCLMRYAGATEQAMFGTAWQLNTLVAYVFSPYAELSKREYAVISEDVQTLKCFYISSLKRMIWLTSYFACFMGFCAEWILRFIYGDKYTSAAFVTLLIMIYTIYQAWGQLTGAFMIATEKTRISAVLSIIGQCVGVVLIFIFQIPNVLFPETLGATGIGLTYMLGNILTVNINVAVIAKIQGWKVRESLCIQFIPVIACSILSFVLYRSIGMVIAEDSVIWIVAKIICSGVLYSVIIALVIWLKPQLVGMEQESIRKMIRVRK